MRNTTPGGRWAYHPDDPIAAAILDATPISLRILYGPTCLRRLCDMQAAMAASTNPLDAETEQP